MERHGDDLLRCDIEGIAGIPRRFDGSLVHRLRDRGARDEVAAKLREDDAFAHRVDLVAAAADALEPAGHRGRRLDLDHEINRAHVNAQLERRSGDERSQLTGFQQVLDLDALRAREGSMMGPHQRFAGQLVQRARETFGEPAAVDEDQRGPVRTNQLQQPRVDRRPDGGARVADRRRTARDIVGSCQPGHVLDRDLDPEVERLPLASVDDDDRAIANGASVRRELVANLALNVARGGMPTLIPAPGGGRAGPLPTIGRRPLDTAEKPRDFVERPLGRRQADTLRRTFAQRGETFDRHGEVRAALGRDERVNLVDDDRVDGAQRVACVRGQEQVQRFRRRDQDVGRRALKPRALGRWGIAGTDRDGRDGIRFPALVGRARDARERRAEIALDIDGQRLQAAKRRGRGNVVPCPVPE